MGPTNVALVRYFQADQLVRAAQAKLDAVTKDVRIQERKVNDLLEKQKLLSANHNEARAQAANLELDVKVRTEHIEKLRTQQQNARNNKEYQTFLIEINTGKVDRSRVEEETIKALQSAETLEAEVKQLTLLVEQEQGKLSEMKGRIDDKRKALEADINSLLPQRQDAAVAVPPRAKDMYQKLADRYDGEALASISKPDRRKEEYLCDGCYMELAMNIYNQLHTHDDLVSCPSCRRILYIPEDFTPEVAVKQKKVVTPRKTSSKKSASAVAAGASADATSQISATITPDMNFPELPPGYRAAMESAAKDSTDIAVADGVTSMDCSVMLDGQLVGYYRGKEPSHLERLMKRRLEDAGLQVSDLQVQRKDDIPQVESTVQ